MRLTCGFALAHKMLKFGVQVAPHPSPLLGTRTEFSYRLKKQGFYNTNIYFL